MDTTENAPLNATPHTPGISPAYTGEYQGDEEYDTKVVAKSLKIPGYLSRELDREIADAGMSFNAYVQNVLMNRHNHVSASDGQELEVLHDAVNMKSGKILEQKEQISFLQAEMEILRNMSDKYRIDRDRIIEERDELSDEADAWEKKAILLQSQLDAFTTSGSHTAEKGDVGEVKALRRIISENTFLTTFDIEQLLHEDSNY